MAASISAQVGQAIRKELKTAFPGMTFRVKKGSGGDSVRIAWVDGPTMREVERLVGRYEMGHFNGMTDSYEYTNRDNTIPQVRFIFTDRDMSEESRQAIIAHVNQRHGTSLEWNGYMWTDGLRDRVGADYATTFVGRVFHEHSMFCTGCHTTAQPLDQFCAECGHALAEH